MPLPDNPAPTPRPRASASTRSADAYAAARLYYEEGLSQEAIAARLGVSRPSVGRLLAAARDQGIVEITVHPPAREGGLAEELADALGLERASVAAAVGTDPAEGVAAEAALHLAELQLGTDDNLCVGWGQTMLQLADAALPRLEGVHAMPAVGGMNESDPAFHGNEVLRRLAARTGATPHFLFAPAVPNPELRELLATDEGIADLTGRWQDLAAALVGIGLPPGDPRATGPAHVRTHEARAALVDAVGDVCMRYFDRDGMPLPYAGEDRVFGLERGHLTACRTVVAVAAGTHKRDAIIGAARARLIDELVTDTLTARAVLGAVEGSRDA